MAISNVISRKRPSVNNMTAVTGTSAQPFIGRLAWFSIYDLRIERNNLELIFNELGLDMGFMPKPINPKDALRRASKEVEGRGFDMGNNTRLNLLVREVASSEKLVTRQLVREVVDSNNKKLDYKPVGEWELAEERGQGWTLKTAELCGGLDKLEEEALIKVVALYEEHRRFYNGDAMRRLVSAFLFGNALAGLPGCSPVSVRPSGGVYFIPIEHESKLLQLQEFVGKLARFSTGQKSTFWTVPVVDTIEQRQMIQESVEDMVKGDAEALMKEMKSMLDGTGRKITALVAQQYIDRVKALKGKVDEYKNLLNDELLNSDSLMEITYAQALKLLDRIDD